MLLQFILITAVHIEIFRDVPMSQFGISQDISVTKTVFNAFLEKSKKFFLFDLINFIP